MGKPGRPPKGYSSSAPSTGQAVEAKTGDEPKKPETREIPNEMLSNDHASKIEEIVARHKAEVEAEARMEGVDVVTEPEPDEEDNDGTSDEGEEVPASEPPQPRQVAPSPSPQAEIPKQETTSPPIEEVEVKIDGVVQKIPYAQFKRDLEQFQKYGSAEKRLQEASLKLKQAQTPPPSGEAVADLKKQYIKAVQYGTEDDALKAMAKYEEALGLSSRHTLDEQAIFNKAFEAAQAATQIKDTEKQWNEKHADIVADPFAYEMVFQRTKARMEMEGGNAFDIATEEAEKMRSWLTGKTGGQTPPSPTVDQLAEKRRLKQQSVDAIPVAGGTPPKAEPPRPKTRAEIIAEMNEARQGVSIRR